MEGVDMSAIREALARRQNGQLGGGGVPMQAQMSQDGGLPPQPAPLPTPTGSELPQQVQQGSPVQQGALQAGQKAQGPSFDPETRDLAKSLIQKLLKGV